MPLAGDDTERLDKSLQGDADSANDNGKREADNRSDLAAQNVHQASPVLAASKWIGPGTVFAGFMISFAGLGYDYAFGIFQAYYETSGRFPNATPTAISFIGALSICLELTCGIITGRLCEIFGMRLVFIAGSVVYVLSFIAASFCTTIPQLIATQGIIRGLGGSVLFMVATAIPVPWFRRRLSLAMGIVACGSGIGGISWSFLVRLWIERYGYQWALRISGLVCVGFLSIAFFFLKTPDTHASAARSTSFVKTLGIFKDPAFLLLYAASAITVFGYVVPFFYLAPYIEQEADASPTLISTIQSVLNIGMICGRLGLAFLADTRFGRVNTVVSAMTLSGIWELTIWGTAGGKLAPSFVFAFLYGACAGGYIGLFPIVLPQLFDKNMIASITGIFFSSEFVGQLVAGPIAGAILTRSDRDYLPVIMYGGSTMILGSCFAIAARFYAQPKLFASI